MRVARAYDRVDVDAMLEELTAAQYGELCAFQELEPEGGLREDERVAQIVAAIYNANPYRTGRAVKPSDVFKTLAAEPRPQNVHAVVAQRRRYIEAHNAAVRAGTMKRGQRHG